MLKKHNAPNLNPQALRKLDPSTSLKIVEELRIKNSDLTKKYNDLFEENDIHYDQFSVPEYLKSTVGSLSSSKC